MSMIHVDKVEEIKLLESDVWVISGMHKYHDEPYPEIQFRITLHTKVIHYKQHCTRSRLIEFNKIRKQLYI